MEANLLTMGKLRNGHGKCSAVLNIQKGHEGKERTAIGRRKIRPVSDENIS